MSVYLSPRESAAARSGDQCSKSGGADRVRFSLLREEAEALLDIDRLDRILLHESRPDNPAAPLLHSAYLALFLQFRRQLEEKPPTGPKTSCAS